MKKNIFKKIVASLATVAMAAGMFVAMPAEEAKAAEVGGDNKVYFVGSETTWEPNDATPYTMESSDGQTFTYELNITEAKKISFKLLVGKNHWDNQRNAKDGSIVLTNVGGSDDFTVECGKTGKVTITAVFEGSTLKSISAEGAAVAPLSLPDEYYVVGEAKLCGTAWGDDNFAGAKALTETSTGVWTITFKNLAAGKYYYNVIQQKSFDNKLEDSSFELDVKSDVVIKYTKTTKKVEVAITPLEEAPPADNSGTGSTGTGSTGTGSTGTGSTGTGSTGTGSTGTGSTGTKKGVTVEVTLDKSLKWDEVYVHAWGQNFGTEWPGVKATAKDGKYYATIDTELTKLSFVVNAGKDKPQTVDIKDVTGKDVKIVVTAEKDKDGKKYLATANGVASTTDKGSVASKADVEKIDKEAVVEGAPADAKLDATEIAADSDAFKVVKEAAKTAFKNKTYVALDLKLLKGTETVQANGDVKVTIPVPTALAKSTKVAVYRVGDDNKLVSCGTADVANGKITFTTNHFSTYVFADASVSTSKPGDAAPIVLMLAVAAVAAGMVVASKKKTICE